MPIFYHTGAKNKREVLWAFYKNFVKANFPLILLKAPPIFVRIKSDYFEEKELVQ